MAWLRLGLQLDPDEVDAMSDLMQRLGAESVSISPAPGDALHAIAMEVPGYRLRPRLEALFPMDVDMDIAVACVRNRLRDDSAIGLSIEAVADRDWEQSARDSFGCQLVGQSLCVCPSWAKPEAGRAVLELDPGMAFGTGTHPTTRLCLEWLERQSLRGLLVTDFGCGSGILGLAALVLGAREALLVDIDEQARLAAQQNAERNRLADVVRIAHPDSLPGQVRANILVANILLNPLKELAPEFRTLLAAGGRIVLSGLLATQVDECLAVYEAWFNMGAPQFKGEWALLEGVVDDGRSRP